MVAHGLALALALCSALASGRTCGSAVEADEAEDVSSLLSLGASRSQHANVDASATLAELQAENRRLQAELKEAWAARDRLFREITKGDVFVAAKITGTPQYVPQNVLNCADEVEAQQKDAFGNAPPETVNGPEGDYTYLNYANDSHYAMELQRAVAAASDVLSNLSRGHFSGKKWAIMFDIDNTLSYSAFNDTDPIGDCPVITEIVAFARRWCAAPIGQGRFDCYFFTARYCTQIKAAATKKWVLDTFPGTNEAWVNQYVHMTGGIGGCASDCSIAYKDVLRAWYAENERVAWAMSMGDQYTDLVGTHSGFKVKVPNPWFDASVVPNIVNHEGECSLKCVDPPDSACVTAGLEDDAIYKYTLLETCLSAPENKEIKCNIVTQECEHV